MLILGKGDDVRSRTKANACYGFLQPAQVSIIEEKLKRYHDLKPKKQNENS